MHKKLAKKWEQPVVTNGPTRSVYQITTQQLGDPRRRGWSEISAGKNKYIVDGLNTINKFYININGQRTTEWINGLQLSDVNLHLNLYIRLQYNQKYI